MVQTAKPKRKPKRKSDALVELERRIDARMRPRVPLTHREFAERYVCIRRRGVSLPFRVDSQPFVGLLFEELDSSRWQTVFCTGPSQSGKTLSAFVIPTLRTAVECREDVVVGVPEADMAADKWDKDFRPTLETSPDLRWLMPTEGPGSKGGRIKDRVTLGNGVDLKIMTRGGQDTAKAGYTARCIRVTEAAGWTRVSETSAEADPLRQLAARMKSYRRHERSMIVEGTVTLEDEYPWIARGADDDELCVSTRSRIVAPCPHCRAWISPEREHLVGWKEAESEEQAAERARFVCPECVRTIDDHERCDAMRECRLVHAGQTVDAKGNVHGETPPTSTLWFRWTAWHNLLLDAADTAVEEWRAAQMAEGTMERENAEKSLCQFVHAVPFRSTLADNEPLKPQEVRKRVDVWRRNVLPADTQRLTVGVDLGDWTGWWFAIAWRESGVMHCPAYGAFDVKRSKADDVETRLLAALHDVADSVFEQGFPQEGTEGHLLPDAVWVDGNYLPDIVARFIRERDGEFWRKRYNFCRGGRLEARNKGYAQPRRISQAYPKLGTQWYGQVNHKRRVPEFTFNAHYWKLYVHERLRTTSGKKGSLSFFQAEVKNEHAKLSHHLCNEQLKRELVPDRGYVEKWVLTGDNHWLDAAAMASAAGDAVGWRLVDAATPEEGELGDAIEAQVVASPLPAPPAHGNFYARMAGRMAAGCR